MTDKQDPIAHAARLLREAAEELRQAHAYSNSEGWENETDAKAAYDEHMAAAQALEDWELAVGAGGMQPLQPTPKAAPGAPYQDSTPHLSVGDSSFEGWFSTYCPANKGDKQRARDAYAAGMGDPLVRAAPQQEPSRDAKTWCSYVAGMIGCYLKKPDESAEVRAIAGIIERRLWALPAPQPAPAPLSRDQIREVFMSNGFTIKEGQTDLKQYVYDAAYALLELVATPPAEQQAATKAAPLQQEWRLVLPGGKHTDEWESARVGDYNRGWNDYRKAAIAALNSVDWSARASGNWVAASTWLRNNYQDYPNITSLCDAMLEAAPQQEAQGPSKAYAWVYVNKYGVDSIPASKDWCATMVSGHGGSMFPLYTAPQPAPAPAPLSDEREDITNTQGGAK